MNITSRNDYLEFNYIWDRQKGYEAHRRRLENVKGSQYYNQREMGVMKGILEHQIKCNQKKDSLKKEVIMENNARFVSRLIEIIQAKPKQGLGVHRYSQPTKRSQGNSQCISEENKKLKLRLSNVTPHLHKKQQDEFFRKHLYYRGRMEKFTQVQEKVMLKVVQNNFQHPFAKKKKKSLKALNLDENFGQRYKTFHEHPKYNNNYRGSINLWGLNESEQVKRIQLVPVFQNRKLIQQLPQTMMVHKTAPNEHSVEQLVFAALCAFRFDKKRVYSSMSNGNSYPFD